MARYLNFKLNAEEYGKKLDEILQAYPYFYDSQNMIVKKAVDLLYDILIKKDKKKVLEFIESLEGGRDSGMP